MALDIACAYYFEVTSASGAAGMAAEESGFALAFDLALLGSGHGFWTHVKSDGGDIRAAKVDGATQLALHLVEIDTTNKKGLIRFNDTSPTAATTWRIYYGNAGASQPAANATYGANNAYGGSACLLAMPLAGTPADYSGTPVTVASDSTDAETTTVKIGKSCRRFNRNNSDKIDLGKPSKLDFSGSAEFTILMLSRPSSSCADGQFRTLYGRGDQVAHLAHRYINAHQAAEAMVYDNNWRSIFIENTYTVDNWHSTVLRCSSSDFNLYVDGTAGAAQGHGSITSPRDDAVYIGENSQDTGRCFDGYIQMLEIYNSSKSADFITSWHRVMMANSSFWPTIGAEKPAPLAWYKADAGLTIDGSNRVAQWDDQSGNGYHITQATDNYKPTKVLAGLNSLPIVRFTNPTGVGGTHQRMENAVNFANVAFTVIAVVKVNNERAWNQTVVGNGANLGLGCMAMNYTGSPRYMGCSSESSYSPSGWDFPSNLSPGTSAFHIQTFKCPNGKGSQYGSYNSTTTMRCYLDRVAASADVTNTQFNGSHSLVVGGNEATQGNDCLDGDVAEILIFNTELTDAERALVYDYLEAKWFPVTTGVQIPWNRNLKNGAMQSMAGGFQ